MGTTKTCEWCEWGKKERDLLIEMDDNGKPGSLANNQAVCYNLNKKTARARRLGIQRYSAHDDR